MRIDRTVEVEVLFVEEEHHGDHGIIDETRLCVRIDMLEELPHAGLPVLAHGVFHEDPALEFRGLRLLGPPVALVEAPPGGHRVEVEVDAVLLEAGHQVVKAVQGFGVEFQIGAAVAREVVIQKVRADEVVALLAHHPRPAADLFVGGVGSAQESLRADRAAEEEGPLAGVLFEDQVPLGIQDDPAIFPRGRFDEPAHVQHAAGRHGRLRQVHRPPVISRRGDPASR